MQYVRGVRLRPASEEDVPLVVSLAHDMKRQLAEWSPIYFRPRRGAEELHAAYLSYLVASEEHDTEVFLDDNDEVLGFFHVVRQPEHWWVDDLYLSDLAYRMDATKLLVDKVPTIWVTCVARRDERRSAALESAGLRVVSSFWARSLVGVPVARLQAAHALPNLLAAGPRHTFGGRSFDPAAPGALVVADPEFGYAIGSAGIEPPLYDPGGPSCVVDRMHGPDRGSILHAAIVTAAARGDAGLVVVADAADDGLPTILLERGFEPAVDLFAFG